MADFPAWDYWAWEQLPGGRQRPVETGNSFLSESDIRNDIYDLDVKNWCRRKHFFWTAQEAALISFGRDPDKVERTKDDFVFHDEVYGPPDNDEDDSRQKDNELRQYITDVHEAILHAQETEVLKPRIPRERYIEWAEGEGIDVPRFVVEAVEEFEREREAEIVEQAGISPEIPGAASEVLAQPPMFIPPVEAHMPTSISLRKKSNIAIL